MSEDTDFLGYLNRINNKNSLPVSKGPNNENQKVFKTNSNVLSDLLSKGLEGSIGTVIGAAVGGSTAAYTEEMVAKRSLTRSPLSEHRDQLNSGNFNLFL